MDMARPTGLATFEHAADGQLQYVIRAGIGQASVLLAFPVATFQPFFGDRSSSATAKRFCATPPAPS